MLQNRASTSCNLPNMYDSTQDSFNTFMNPGALGMAPYGTDLNLPCAENYPLSSAFPQDKQYSPYNCGTVPLHGVSEPMQSWFNLQLNSCQFPETQETLGDDAGMKSYTGSMYNPVDSFIYPQCSNSGGGYQPPTSVGKQPSWYYPTTTNFDQTSSALFEHQEDPLLLKQTELFDSNRWPYLSSSDVTTVLQSRPPSSETESDIIVEESDHETEVSNSEVVVDESSSSEECLVCCGPGWIRLTATGPVTLVSRTPVVTALGQLLPPPHCSSVSLSGAVLCSRCLSLVDTTESLQLRLDQLRSSIVRRLVRVLHIPQDVSGEGEENIIDVVEETNLDEPTRSPSPIVVPMTEEVTNTSEELTCSICSKAFTSKRSLDRHYKGHSLRFQCEKCGKVYCTRHRLEDHLMWHSGKYRLYCDHCGKGFMQPYTLRSHLVSIHALPEGEKQYECKRCGKCFLSETGLGRHLCRRKEKTGRRRCRKRKQEGEEEELNCLECGKRFKERRVLLRHRRKFHNGGAPPTKECPVCHKQLRYSLTVHMRAHTGHKPYKCHLCPNSFSVRSSLNKHKRTKHPNTPPSEALPLTSK